MPSTKGLGPISYQGAPIKGSSLAENIPVINLRVHDTKRAGFDEEEGYALINPETSSPWRAFLEQGQNFVGLADASDCVVSLRLDARVPQGSIVLDSVQQHNLHVAPGETYSFSIFVPPPPDEFQLCDLEGEVRLFRSREASTSGAIEVDAQCMTQQLGKQLFRRAVAVNELVLVQVDDISLIVRVAAVNNLDEAAREEALSYHCYRGLVTPDTLIYLVEQGGVGNSTDMHGSIEAAVAPGSRLQLTNKRERPPKGKSTAILDVLTADGEVFPVKRKLLRPCINLTQAVRSNAPSVSLNVNTLVFDRVLIYLEAEASGKPLPCFAVHLLGDLLHAGEALGLRSLQDYCREKLGKLDSRIQLRSFKEVKAHNAAGQCWLTLDGMVLDVTRWLPEHPGGSTIIPAQALDIDCGRFFEVYHSSRESFLYLREFYIGELLPGDWAAVPCPEQPSPEFLAQLRSYTSFRQKLDEELLVKAFKSF